MKNRARNNLKRHGETLKSKQYKQARVHQEADFNLTEWLRLERQLDELIDIGRDETDEAEKLRGYMDEVWLRLTENQRRFVDRNWAR